jgi:hypothetical protein
MKLDLRSALGASLAGLVCFATVVPAHALAKSVNTPATDLSSSSSSRQVAAKSGPKQHCMVMESLTGSRVKARKCKTVAEWEALGYEFKSAS